MTISAGSLDMQFVLAVVPLNLFRIAGRVRESDGRFPLDMFVRVGKLKEERSRFGVSDSGYRVNRFQSLTVSFLRGSGRRFKPVVERPITEAADSGDEDVGLYALVHPRDNRAVHGSVVVADVADALSVNPRLRDE